MHYLLYLPRKSGANPENLRAAGLGTLLRPDDEGPKFAELTGPGPDDGAGQLVGWPRPGERFGYFPAEQVWQPAKPDPRRGLAAGRYWIGIEQGERCRPEDLARRRLHEGFAVRLGDGREWQVPNAMNLPHVFGQGDDGYPARIPAADFQEVYRKTLWALERMEEYFRDGVVPDWLLSFEYSAEIVSLNYRIDWQIAAWLGLFDDANVLHVMARSTDVRRLYAIQQELSKKNDPAIPAGS